RTRDGGRHPALTAAVRMSIPQRSFGTGRAARSASPPIRLSYPIERTSLMSTASPYVITPQPQAAIAGAGGDKGFPVRRIWCVGRNYVEHIREMGQDERLPPF